MSNSFTFLTEYSVSKHGAERPQKPSVDILGTG